MVSVIPSYKRQICSCGYTLIETMIVVTITVLVVAGALAAYIKFNSAQITKQAVMNIAIELKQVQKMADAGINSCGTNIFQGYPVTTVTNSTQMTINQRCSGTNSLVKSVSLPDSLKFGSDTSMIFKPLSQGVDTNVTVTFNYADGTSTGLTIVVTQGGVIKTNF